jgi:hypothetical protein
MGGARGPSASPAGPPGVGPRCTTYAQIPPGCTPRRRQCEWIRNGEWPSLVSGDPCVLFLLSHTHTHTHTHSHSQTHIYTEPERVSRSSVNPPGGGVGGPKPASRSSTKLESGVPWPTYARHRHHARRPAPLAAPLSSPCAPEQGVAQNVIDRSVGTLESCPVTCSTLAAGLCAVEMPPTDPQ